MSATGFDHWRKNYKDFPDSAICKIYDECYKRDPQHTAFSGRAVRVFLNQFKGCGDIFEVGGRSGLLAKIALESTPELKSWVNVEISKAPLDANIVKDKRYKSVFMPNFRWWKDTKIEGNLLLLVHIIEHLSDEDAKDLISRIPENIKGVHVQAPIMMRGPMDWTGFNGAHILSMGWVELNEEFEKNGFKSINAYDGATWKRK